MQPLAQSLPRQRRISRSPNHRFFLRHRPWEIQPFFIAPVLPGETLQSLRFQARKVTDPINNRTIGWWDEYYFFYVKLRDLVDDSVAFQSMFMDPGFSPASSFGSEADLNATYFQAGAVSDQSTTIDYVKRCLQRVTDCYFRREGESAFSNSFAASGLPVANINFQSWIDSAIPVASLEGLIENPDLTSTTPGVGDGTAAVTPKEIQAALEQYEWARQMMSTEMTFEDFCAEYGVMMPKADLHCPELIRYVRSWQYPSNTIDPTSGAARSAVSWSHQASVGKKVLCKEPGFFFGVTVTRPKCYLAKLNSHAAGLIHDHRGWLPPMFAHDPAASFQALTSGEPPLDSSTSSLAVDMKDLYMHGDQFLNLDLTQAITALDANLVNLPANDGSNLEYPASTDADNLFVTGTANVGKVEVDGIVSLRILGRQTDTSPSGVGAGYTV